MSRPPVSSGSSSSALTSEPDSLFHGSSESVSDPQSPLTPLPGSELSDSDYNDKMAIDEESPPRSGLSAPTTMSAAPVWISPRSSPAPSPASRSSRSPQPRRAGRSRSKDIVIPPLPPAPTKPRAVGKQRTVTIFGVTMTKPSYRTQKKAPVVLAHEQSRSEPPVETSQVQQQEVEAQHGEQKIEQTPVAQPQVPHLELPFIDGSASSPSQITSDVVADNKSNPSPTLSDLGKIPKIKDVGLVHKIVLQRAAARIAGEKVRDLYANPFPDGTVAHDGYRTQAITSISAATTPAIVHPHSPSSSSPQHQSSTPMEQAQGDMPNSHSYSDGWLWTDADTQIMAQQRAGHAKRDNDPDFEPDVSRMSQVAASPALYKNPLRKSYGTKRKRQEEPEVTTPVEFPSTKRTRTSAEEPESTAWTHWAPHPPMRNWEYVRRSVSKARTPAFAHWTNGFVKPSGKRAQRKTQVLLPPPCSPPTVWFGSWTDILEAPNYGRLRYGVQVGIRDFPTLTATVLVLEGIAGPASSWDGDTLTITTRRAMTFVDKKPKRPKRRSTGPERATLKDQRLSIDQAGLLNSWDVGHHVDILVKNDFSLLPFRLDATYALLGAYKIEEVFESQDESQDADKNPKKYRVLKFVFKWDQEANRCSPWWVQPSDAISSTPTARASLLGSNESNCVVSDLRKHYSKLDHSVVSASESAIPSADKSVLDSAKMASVLFGTTVCQQCGGHAYRDRLVDWTCAQCSTPMGPWQLSPDWLRQVEASVGGTTLSFDVIKTKSSKLETAETLSQAVQIGRTAWSAKPLPCDSADHPIGDPDCLLKAFLEEPLPMLRVPLSGSDFTCKETKSPWFIHTSTWDERVASTRPEAQMWGTALPAATKAMSLLNAFAKTLGVSRLFYTMHTVLSCSGRDCRFIVRPGDEIAMLALRGTVLVRVALRYPPKKVRASLLPTANNRDITEGDSGNPEVDINKTMVASSTSEQNDVETRETAIAMSAPNGESDTIDTGVDAGKEAKEGRKKKAVTQSPKDAKKVAMSIKMAQKPNTKGLKALTKVKKITPGASDKGKGKGKRKAIVTQIKGKCIKGKAKFGKAVKIPKAPRKPPAPPRNFLLQHGDRVVLCADEEIIVTLQWKACAFVCIGTHSNAPPHARALDSSRETDVPIDECESEDDAASSIFFEQEEEQPNPTPRASAGGVLPEGMDTTAPEVVDQPGAMSLEEEPAALSGSVFDSMLVHSDTNGDYEGNGESDMNISDSEGSRSEISDSDDSIACMERSGAPVLDSTLAATFTSGDPSLDLYEAPLPPYTASRSTPQCLPGRYPLSAGNIVTERSDSDVLSRQLSPGTVSEQLEHVESQQSPMMAAASAAGPVTNHNYRVTEPVRMSGAGSDGGSGIVTPVPSPNMPPIPAEYAPGLLPTSLQSAATGETGPRPNHYPQSPIDSRSADIARNNTHRIRSPQLPLRETVHSQRAHDTWGRQEDEQRMELKARSAFPLEDHAMEQDQSDLYSSYYGRPHLLPGSHTTLNSRMSKEQSFEDAWSTPVTQRQHLPSLQARPFHGAASDTSVHLPTHPYVAQGTQNPRYQVYAAPANGWPMHASQHPHPTTWSRANEQCSVGHHGQGQAVEFRQLQPAPGEHAYATGDVGLAYPYPPHSIHSRAPTFENPMPPAFGPAGGTPHGQLHARVPGPYTEQGFAQPSVPHNSLLATGLNPAGAFAAEQSEIEIEHMMEDEIEEFDEEYDY
ncbi:hypothetical protein CALVIDRAFT_594125 [Calocera viscosa TUFC12733]|uniref:Uncharacterized protein n=1 Tax=Calocera viscosa (strain TUFC12733) TaxID=1330018 RepID=A0A167RY23_CALVF|nr:hypothetical protein CALVIDRAFT_594125 [Calocera viscosa TUFC12733]